MKHLYILFIILSTNVLSAQLKKNVDYRKIVLEKSIIGRKFTFGKWDEKGNDELQLTYLGKLKNKSKTYKIMNSIWYWGSGRATSRILLFDIKNKFIGDYYLTLTCEVPKRIKNNCLQFEYDCDKNTKKVVTNISFNDGIPKYLVVKSGGLISTFEKAN